MRINFSHGDAQWGYIGFTLFRSVLADHEGFDLMQMEGFGPLRSGVPHPCVPWDTVTTPLRPLLDHSDVEGHLTPEECRQVASRLREIIPVIWPDSAARDRVRGMCLVYGMEEAADAGELFKFM